MDGRYHHAACFDKKSENSKGELRAIATGHFFRMHMRTHHMSGLGMANPEGGVTYTYLTSDFTLPAYQIVLLYKHRRDIGKIFHQFKSKMNERKSWASSHEAKQSHPADAALHPLGARLDLHTGSLAQFNHPPQGGPGQCFSLVFHPDQYKGRGWRRGCLEERSAETVGAVARKREGENLRYCQMPRELPSSGRGFAAT